MQGMISAVSIDVSIRELSANKYYAFDSADDFNIHLEKALYALVPRFWFKGVEFSMRKTVISDSYATIRYSASVDVSVGDTSELIEAISGVFLTDSMRKITNGDDIRIHYDAFVM